MEDTVINEISTTEYPVIALRGKVLCPKTFLNFDVGRLKSVRAAERALENGSLVIITAQKNAFIDDPKDSDLNLVCTLAKIKQIMKMANGNIKLNVEALERVRVLSFDFTKDYISAIALPYPYVSSEDEEQTEAYFRAAKNAFYEYTLFDKRITKDMLATVSALDDPNAFIDNAISVANVKESDVQEVLETESTVERLKKFFALFTKELEISKIEKKINSSVRKSIDQSQKEFYLREQLKAIHNELGDDENETDKLTREIKAKGLPKEAEEKALKEISRLEKINPSSPDYSIILNYLDWIKDLPFNETTEDTESLKKAKEILDADHFGLEKVKERIVEYIAVLKLTKKIQGPILCFVGPPGVGKTSIAASVARALNRKFIRMSLGGVKDEAEIRGHRKTYVGAMPGRIIYGMKNAGSSNPVFLLDEIDKMSSDMHGDPASALLEVLDPEQNVNFRDRYLELPFDLSKVMFITTANSLDTIPYPLLDRMEVIELTGYTDEEKYEIAKRYLIPKQLKLNGVSKNKAEITEQAIKSIISFYTMEAGVRNLEREIGKLIRKIACMIAENSRLKKQTVTAENIEEYLGAKKFVKDISLEKDEIGCANGLAWTSVGGTTLNIEAALMHGKGEVQLTGKLGDVMKESAKTALSYIKANADKYGINSEVFEQYDVHVHVPEGATPKDGPSAGITIATALLSAFTQKSVKSSVAMTGEITLRGKVLPIGGLKEKALAAFRRGIKTVVIPKANERDLEQIPKEIFSQMRFVPVEGVDKVFEIAINL